MVRVTSASTRKLAVSDQASAVISILCIGWANSAGCSRVKGHGPAIQDMRMLRNSSLFWASREKVLVEAFHLPSGEQGRWPLHGMFPVFSTSNCFTTLPTLMVVCALSE